MSGLPHIYDAHLLTIYSCIEYQKLRLVYTTSATGICFVCCCCFNNLLSNAAIKNGNSLSALHCCPLLMGCGKQTVWERCDSLFVNAVGEERHLFLKSKKKKHLLPPPPRCSLSCTKHFADFVCVFMRNIPDFRCISPFPWKSSILFQTAYKGKKKMTEAFFSSPLGTRSVSAVVLGVKQTGEKPIHNIQ